MNSRILDVYPKIPLFTTLLLFTITFFVYDDFGIRMSFGYAALMYVALIYLIFRKTHSIIFFEILFIFQHIL